MLFDARRLSIHFDPQYLHAFDVAAAQEAGDLMASRHRKGRPGELRDTMIAGTALAQHAALATRNTAHSDDVPVTLINPCAPYPINHNGHQAARSIPAHHSLR